MKEEKIKAELRRSALEDDFPYMQCSHDAWVTSCRWRSASEKFMTVDHSRVFFLLLAEAL